MEEEEEEDLEVVVADESAGESRKEMKVTELTSI